MKISSLLIALLIPLMAMTLSVYAVANYVWFDTAIHSELPVTRVVSLIIQTVMNGLLTFFCYMIRKELLAQTQD